MQLEIKRRGLMLVISAPSGTGKTTLTKLIQEVDKHIHASISVTTRSSRPDEVHGKDYYFVDKETFHSMLEADVFLEYAKIFDNLYGTLRNTVAGYLNSGEDVIFDIDWQGHRQLVATARDDVTSVFLLPPSKQEIVRRMQSRAQDGNDTMRARLERMDNEISHWHEYDYVIINRDIDESLQKLLAILRAERLKKARRLGLPKFIQSLLQENIDLELGALPMQ